MNTTLKFILSVISFSILGGGLFVLADSYVPFKLFQAKPVESEAPASVPSHEEPHAIVLNAQALKNIGITNDSIIPVVISSYDKTMSFPAIITDRPGRSTFRVPAPFGGVVQKIYVEPGMIVQPGQPLFDLAPTHEDLISCQNEMIALLQKRDTIDREIDRLGSLASDIAPKAKRDTEFQKAEIDSQIDTQRNILLLHGISADAINETIEQKRKLIRSVTVSVPHINHSPNNIVQGSSGLTPQKPKVGTIETGNIEEDGHQKLIQMESLSIEMGQLVSLGDPLCQLADLSLLNIEGRASTINETILATALMNHCPVTASFDKERVDNLHIRYIDTRIDPVSRALRFYVELPNSIMVRDEKTAHQHDHDRNWVQGKQECDCDLHRNYINWRFRPGQRCELKVEYDTISSCIVVPREAIAESGNEAFLFEWTGSEPDGEKRKIWTKRPVHVLHRSKSQIAIANDGSIFPGAKIASRGAGQLLVSLTSGGGQLQSTCPCGEH